MSTLVKREWFDGILSDLTGFGLDTWCDVCLQCSKLSFYGSDLERKFKKTYHLKSKTKLEKYNMDMEYHQDNRSSELGSNVFPFQTNGSFYCKYHSLFQLYSESGGVNLRAATIHKEITIYDMWSGIGKHCKRPK